MELYLFIYLWNDSEKNIIQASAKVSKGENFWSHAYADCCGPADITLGRKLHKLMVLKVTVTVT